MVNKQELLERFLTYVRFDTRSDETSQTIPSTQSQIDFALTVLRPEMEAVGLQDIHYNQENGYIIGTLPANSEQFSHKIGLLAHMDTADFESREVKPQIIENYDGRAISLGDSPYTLSPDDFPQLAHYKGQTLITTDGTTLLGADDKAGIAEILTAIAYLKEHPEQEHCEIRVGFGPDEEIGIGADRFDAAGFAVDFAYTVDGGPLGELQYESFNAASADLVFTGRNVHPGTAKGQMINALQMAIDFHQQLPEADRPETTAGYEGFYHLHDLSGTVEEARSSYIIRDFNQNDFIAKKAHLEQIVADLNRSYGANRVELRLKDQYYNMRQMIEKDMTPVELAKTAMLKNTVQPIIEPIRGGTDGSKISFMGIPTPNLFAGGENMHGRFEFISLETMVKATEVLVGIVTEK